MNTLTRPDGALGFLDSLFEGACVVDESLTLLRWNHAAETITGYTPAEVLGRRCRDDLLLALDPVRGTVHSVTGLLADTFRDHGQREINAYLRHKDGSCIPARVRMVPVWDAVGQVQVAAYLLSPRLGTDPFGRRNPEGSGGMRTDAVTGMVNRRLIEQHLRTGLSEMYRHGWAFGVILTCVRGIHDLAASRGSAVADRVLLAVAKTLTNQTGPHDIWGCWGKGAFLAVCRNIDRQGLEDLADTFRALAGAASCQSTRLGTRLRAATGAALAAPGHTFDSLVRQVEDLAACDQHAPG